jgi:hypothetical protein
MVALRTGEPVHQVVMGVQVPDRGCTWLLVNATPVWRDGGATGERPGRVLRREQR